MVTKTQTQIAYSWYLAQPLRMISIRADVPDPIAVATRIVGPDYTLRDYGSDDEAVTFYAQKYGEKDANR